MPINQTNKGKRILTMPTIQGAVKVGLILHPNGKGIENNTNILLQDPPILGTKKVSMTNYGGRIIVKLRITVITLGVDEVVRLAELDITDEQVIRRIHERLIERIEVAIGAQYILNLAIKKKLY